MIKKPMGYDKNKFTITLTREEIYLIHKVIVNAGNKDIIISREEQELFHNITELIKNL